MKLNKNLLFIGLIIAAVATRFIPHAPNFTAVGAAALLGGFAFKDSWKAFLIPLLAMFLSDLILNNIVYAQYYEGFTFFSGGFYFIYAGFLLSVVFGRYFTKGFKPLPLIGAGLASAIVFYLITNYGAWLSSPIYSKDFAGLMASYIAGLPYLYNQILGTFLYGGVMFGAAYYALSAMQPTKVHA